MSTPKRSEKEKNRDLQKLLNVFAKGHLYGVSPLIEDGRLGQATIKRIRRTKYWLGYLKNDTNGYPSVDFRKRLRHPNTKVGSATQASIERGRKRRSEQRKLAKANEAYAANNVGKGFGTFEGKTVAKWMIPILKKTRAYSGSLGKWQGRVISGVRTPAYSEHLCYAMCGRPSCPGLCAGRASNHNMESGQGKPHGALDVSDYIRFGKIQRAIGSPLVNRLANDRVHFSVSGR